MSTATISFPAGDFAEEAERRTDRLIRFGILLTLVLAAARLLVIGQIELYPDEVYYWLWSQQLDITYYDHPPMVALVIWLGTAIFGDNEFGVRVAGVVLVSIDQALVFAIAKTLTQNRRIAAWTLLLSNVTALAAMSVFMVPDQPMMFFWLIAFYAMARIARGGAGWWWLVVGLGGGFATLSKLTTLIMAAAVPLWLLAVPKLRHWLRSPWIYAGLVIALILFAPVIVWNMQNDWSTFSIQIHRGRPLSEPSVGSLLGYLVLWPAMVTPLILILGGVGLGIVLRRGWLQDPVRSLMVITLIPLSIYLFFHALYELVSPHWFAPLVWIVVILAAVAITQTVSGRWGRVLLFTRRIIVPLGLVITAGIYLVMTENVLPFTNLDDPTSRFRGWDEYVNDQERLRARTGADYILGPDYYNPAYIRFYVDNPPPAYQLGDFDRWSHFHGLGTAPAAFADGVGLYVGKWGIEYETAFLSQYFNTVERYGIEAVRPLRNGVGDRRPGVPGLRSQAGRDGAFWICRPRRRETRPAGLS